MSVSLLSGLVAFGTGMREQSEAMAAQDQKQIDRAKELVAKRNKQLLETKYKDKTKAYDKAVATIRSVEAEGGVQSRGGQAALAKYHGKSEAMFQKDWDAGLSNYEMIEAGEAPLYSEPSTDTIKPRSRIQELLGLAETPTETDVEQQVVDRGMATITGGDVSTRATTEEERTQLEAARGTKFDVADQEKTDKVQSVKSSFGLYDTEGFTSEELDSAANVLATFGGTLISSNEWGTVDKISGYLEQLRAMKSAGVPQATVESVGQKTLTIDQQIEQAKRIKLGKGHAPTVRRQAADDLKRLEDQKKTIEKRAYDEARETEKEATKERRHKESLGVREEQLDINKQRLANDIKRTETTPASATQINNSMARLKQMYPDLSTSDLSAYSVVVASKANDLRRRGGSTENEAFKQAERDSQYMLDIPSDSWKNILSNVEMKPREDLELTPLQQELKNRGLK